MDLLNRLLHEIVDHFAAEGEPFSFKFIGILVEEDVSRLREYRPPFGFVSEITAESGISVFGITGIHGVVIVAATVHDDSVKTFVGSDFPKHREKEFLNLGIGRVEETSSHCSVVVRLVHESTVRQKIDGAPVFPFRMVEYHSHLESVPAFPSSDHHVDSGMNAQAGIMARLYEGGQIVEVSASFPESEFSGREPCGNLRHLGRDRTAEQDVSACGTDVHHDVGETHVGDSFAVTRDGIGVIRIGREIGRCVNPQEMRLLRLRLLAAGDKGQNEK